MADAVPRCVAGVMFSIGGRGDPFASPSAPLLVRRGWLVRTFGPGETIELEPGIRITVDEIYAT